MKPHLLFHSISYFLALATFIFCTSIGICQQRKIVVSFDPETYEEKFQIIYDTITPLQREILHNAYSQMDFHGVVSDSIITKLITIADDSLTIDSVKVEIVRFFGRACCNKCITYLFVHMNDRFNYGEGVSDTDQMNYTAAWSTLLKIASDKHYRWYLFPFIFNELKRETKYEEYFSALYPILIFNADKNTIRCIFEFELNEAISQWYNMRNYIYEDNLRHLLKRLN
jgi:hypothetical protein